MSEKTLGLIMILRDEADNLGRSLAPCAKYFDEIVAVDTGSTDDTARICSELGAKVFDFTWIDDFAAARNFSIAKAKADWLFWLDGDNAVLGNDINKLRLSLPHDEPCVFWAMEKVESTGGVLWQKRCFPNRPEVKFTGRVHEQLSHPAFWPLIHSEVIVNHWGYEDPQKMKVKGEYYLGLLEKTLSEDPNDYYAHFQSARCHINFREFEKAEKHLIAMINDPKILRSNNQLWAHGHFLLAQCLKRLGDQAGAWNLLQDLVEKDPKNALAHFHLGRLAFDLAYWHKAKVHLKLFLRLDGREPVVDLDPVATEFKAWYFLGRSLEKLGELDKALYSLKKALEIIPEKIFVHAETARILHSMDKSEQAIEHLEKMLAQRPEDRTAQRLLARIREAA